jgi:predicted enzyme related to lactoylglutathione lyase
MECQSPYRKVINYIIVSSVDEYISKIEKAGGKIIISKTDIPNRNLCNIF